MPSITQIPRPAASPRVETGAVQFGGDWPGLFIRGDDAVFLAESIRQLAKGLPRIDDLQLGMAFGRLVELADVIERDVVVK
jgi:hypothetical protein